MFRQLAPLHAVVHTIRNKAVQAIRADTQSVEAQPRDLLRQRARYATFLDVEAGEACELADGDRYSAANLRTLEIHFLC